MRDEERVSEGGRESSEEQRRREALDQLKRLRVADLVEEMLVSLVTVGYQKLGLTGQTRELRDLRDARLAIEALRAWVDVLVRERGEEGLADLRSTVAAMQLSYARVASDTADDQGAPAGQQEGPPGEASQDERTSDPADEAPAEQASPTEDESQGESDGERVDEKTASEGSSG
jgi:hypothetical protein